MELSSRPMIRSSHPNAHSISVKPELMVTMHSTGNSIVIVLSAMSVMVRYVFWLGVGEGVGVGLGVVVGPDVEEGVGEGDGVVVGCVVGVGRGVGEGETDGVA